MMKTVFAMAAVGAALVGFSGTASAATTLEITSKPTAIYGSTFTADVKAPGVKNGNYQDNVIVSPQNVIGKLDNVAVTLTAFCIDLAQYSGAGTFTVKTLAEYVTDSTKYNAITALVNGFAASSPSALVSAATQVAIWEVFYEKNSNGFDVTDDQFKGRDWRGGNVAGTANNLLAGLGGVTINPNLDIFVATNKDKQDLLFFVQRAPVPEPTTWAMMIMGLGLAGGMLRRRASRTTVSFA